MMNEIFTHSLPDLVTAQFATNFVLLLVKKLKKYKKIIILIKVSGKFIRKTGVGNRIRQIRKEVEIIYYIIKINIIEKIKKR